MHAAQVAKDVTALTHASKAVTKLAEYAEGTLTPAQYSCLRGRDWELYVDNYFKRFGYVFPALTPEEAADRLGVAAATVAGTETSAAAGGDDSTRRAPRINTPGYDVYRHCAHCLTMAMEENIDDAGYGTDPDVCAALDARRAWSAKQAAKQAQKLARKLTAKARKC
jgi:hypothetical protein